MSARDSGVPQSVPPASRAYEGFRGRVGMTMSESESWWPERSTAAAGAPNVVVVLCDDLGYSDIASFGSEIPTPNLDRLAQEGVRMANFHVTPMCSPTRAALLSGRNAHAAGVGYVAHADPGFPGLAMELADDVSTIAEALKANGYATLAVGKWHLCKDSDITESGSRESWPLQRGFDRFYGFMDGQTDMFHPHGLFRDNSRVAPDSFPDGYYLTDDLTEEAITMVRQMKASDPGKPFFLYFAHGAVHAPLNAPAEDIEQHRGKYAEGWDRLRQRRFARQLELGVVKPGTVCAPRNSEPGDDVPPWDSLDDRRQQLFARYMEVYAAMVTTVDRSLGQVRAALEELGEWDNTIVVFTSDNGASREGQEAGTTQYGDVLRRYHGATSDLDSFERDFAAMDLIGGPRTQPHYPRGWAMASNTPFRLYKINAHAGGHTVPTIVSWPAELRSVGGEVRHQYAHVTDLYPTLLAACRAHDLRQRRGIPLKPLAGSDFLPVLRDRNAPSTHPEQSYEMLGHRAYYADGWEIVTRHAPRTPFSDEEWELYDVESDPAQTKNLAAVHPERVAELARRWEAAAWENQVFPMDDGIGLLRERRPEREDVFKRPVTIVPGTPTLERYRSLMLVYRRSFSIVIDVEMQPEDEGVLFAHGGKGGGYSMSVTGGRLHHLHNHSGQEQELDCGPLGAGRHDIRLHADAHAGGAFIDVRVLVDGEERAGADRLPMPLGLSLLSGIDVGLDRGSPVSWSRYEQHGTYPWTGTLHAISWIPGEPA